MSKLEHVTIGFDVAANAYGPESMPAETPRLCYHTFRATQDGQLEHLMDGKLRATVPPEGMHDYCEHFPEARRVVGEILGAAAPLLSPKAAAAVAVASAVVKAVSGKKKRARKK